MAEDKPTIGEVTRGMAALSEQIHRLHEETLNQHHRVRNDMASAMGTIQADIKSMSGDVKAHEERLRAQGKELNRLTEDVDEVRGDHKWLLRAIVGAYGAIALSVIGVLVTKVVA